MNVSQNFPLDRKIQNGVALVLTNSGEAHIPISDLSSTSDTAEVETMSSPELQVDPMLAFLEGKSVVASALLTTTRALGE